MGRHERDDQRTTPDPESARRALVYMPCPACGRAVHFSHETRVEDDPETYECPHCGARVLLVESRP
jgi:predicted RNA-binding Zn-ribbon protein involved in translation (DUF1610 family)